MTEEDPIARDRIDALIRRVDRMEDHLNHRFAGFPQEYGTAHEVDALRNSIEAIRADHVQRREIDAVQESQTTAAENVRKRLDEATGRQAATRISAAVTVTLLGIAFGAVWKAQLTHGDVSQQIQNEAPWLRDRPQIERDLQTLQSSEATQQQRIAAIEALDRFFCRTRTKSQLPGC